MARCLFLILTYTVLNSRGFASTLAVPLVFGWLMTKEEITADLNSANIMHVHFKTKLRSFLYGNSPAEGPLRDPEQCTLGQWIASRWRGAGPYAHLAEARQFDRQHMFMHREANRLMDMHLTGRKEEAMTGLEAMQGIATEMAALLRTMEAKLRTNA